MGRGQKTCVPLDLYEPTRYAGREEDEARLFGLRVAERTDISLAILFDLSLQLRRGRFRFAVRWAVEWTDCRAGVAE